MVLVIQDDLKVTETFLQPQNLQQMVFVCPAGISLNQTQNNRLLQLNTCRNMQHLNTWSLNRTDCNNDMMDFAVGGKKQQALLGCDLL